MSNPDLSLQVTPRRDALEWFILDHAGARVDDGRAEHFENIRNLQLQRGIAKVVVDSTERTQEAFEAAEAYGWITFRTDVGRSQSPRPTTTTAESPLAGLDWEVRQALIRRSLPGGHETNDFGDTLARIVCGAPVAEAAAVCIDGHWFVRAIEPLPDRLEARWQSFA